MTRIGYLGSTKTPEFATLIERKDVTIAAVDNADASQDADTQVYASPEGLISTANVDGLVIASAASDRLKFGTLAVEHGRPFFVSTSDGVSASALRDVADAAEKAGVVTAVNRPMRYSINLVQIRQTVKRDGVAWLLGRVVLGPADGADLVAQTEPIVDLVRYIGGEFAAVEVARLTDTTLTADLRMKNGARALITAVSGWQHGEEQSLEVITGAGSRMSWSYGPNMLKFDDYETRAADSVQGTQTASLAAFTTTLRTGRTGPILADLTDAVGTAEALEAIRSACA